MKYGDKVKINVKTWLGRSACVSYDDYNEAEIEYEYTLEGEDKELIGFMMENVEFTVSMADNIKHWNVKRKMFTLKELEDKNIHIVFMEDELIKI